MIKNGKLFCFIGAGLFLINAIIFFAFHTSIPVILGVASVIVAVAITALALLPWLRIVLDIVSIVVSFVSAYLLTDAIRQLPSAIVVPSNLLVFCGFVLVLVGGVLEIVRLKNKSPFAKKGSKSTEDDSLMKKQECVKTHKIRKKGKGYTSSVPLEYNLNNDFQYEPEVMQFVEYLKKENSSLQNEIGCFNISTYYKRLKILHSFTDLPNYFPGRETVTPNFFVHLMKWVMNNYCDQHLDDKLLHHGMDFALSFETLYKNHSGTVLLLTVDDFSPSAAAYSLIKDDILEARVRFHDKWHTTRELKYEDFASNRLWLAYKKDKDDYEKYCQNIESKATTLVYNHVVDVITPIANRLYKSLNVHLTSSGMSKYIINELVVDVGSMEGSGKMANSK